MTTALTLRDELAATVTATFTAAAVAKPELAPVIVYSYPAELIAVPAVVFVPDEPYWVPSHFSSSAAAAAGSRLRVNFELQILVPRTELEETQKLAELMATTTVVALFSSPIARWDSVGQPTEVELGEIPAIMLSVSCHAYV